VQTAIRTDPDESKQGYVRLKRVFAGREHGIALAEDNDKTYSWGRCDTGQCGRAVDATTGPAQRISVLHLQFGVCNC
jgi:alpha-tubulin suppressor-like RCC1 family protein